MVSTAVNLASMDAIFSARNLNDSVVLACKHSTTSFIDSIFWEKKTHPVHAQTRKSSLTKSQKETSETLKLQYISLSSRTAN